MTNNVEQEMKQLQKENRIKTVKGIIRLAITGLVEAFVGAATNIVVSRTDNSRLARFGAKAGGFLVGMYLGEQVSDHICSSIDETMKDIEDLKNQIDEEA